MTVVQILALAERSSDPADAGREGALAALLAAGDEVAAALAELSATDRAAAMRLAASLSAFWQDSGRVEEGRRLTEALLASTPPTPSESIARAIVVASELAFRQGDQAAAAHHARLAITHGRSASDPRAIGLAHLNLARIAFRDGDAAGIEAEARAALAEAPDDIATQRGALHMLAWAAYTAGDRASARRRFQESLELRRTMGDRFGVAVEDANLADLAVEDGDLADAARRLGSALRVAQELGSTYLVLNLIPSISALAARSGDDESCARLVGATDALSQASGLVPDPGDWQSSIEEARVRLGAAFEQQAAAGRGLAGSEAVDLALAVADRAAGRDVRSTWRLTITQDG